MISWLVVYFWGSRMDFIHIQKHHIYAKFKIYIIHFGKNGFQQSLWFSQIRSVNTIQYIRIIIIIIILVWQIQNQA